MGSIHTDRIAQQNKENICQFQTSTLEQQSNQQKAQMLTNLSNRIKKNFKQSIIASKNIHLQAKPPQKINQNEILGIGFEEIIPIFAPINKNRLRKPTFQMIQIQSKMFFELQERPILEDYQIQGQIGRGGYGSVARGIERKSGEVRAIKKIEKIKLSPSEKESLMNQFQILCRLDHPNIIKLYEVYNDNTYLYVVTEICQGGNLLAFVNSHKSSQKMIRQIATQMLGAISYMHSVNIFHRDIKLQNIVLVKKITNSYEKIQLKIIDLGIALNMSHIRNNQEIDAMGTLMYMSPECIAGKARLSSDIWSCGIALYMIATRKLPYKYVNESQLLEKATRGQIIRKNLQKLSLGLKVLIIEMLSISPQSRVTAQKALKNPWIRKVHKKQLLSQQRKYQAVKNLFDYDAKNNLISMIEGYLICKRINQQERQHLARVFQEIDQDSSGRIQIGELKKFYEKNSEHYQQKDVEQLLKILDKNKSGKIDFNEFITAMCSRRKLFQLQHLEQAFDFFDKDKSGKLQKQQLQSILNGIEVQQIEYLFAQLDKNNDSVISKKQFLSYLTKHEE